MNLHLNKELFKDMIDTLNTRTGISIDIIEKDYYVCLILEELSKKQNKIKAYFKLNFDDKLIKEFENMQNKYILNDKYRISIDKVKTILKEIYDII